MFFDTFLLVGGFQSYGYLSNDSAFLNLHDRSWTKILDKIPTDLQATSCCFSSGDKLFIIGG